MGSCQLSVVSCFIGLGSWFFVLCALCLVLCALLCAFDLICNSAICNFYVHVHLPCPCSCSCSCPCFRPFTRLVLRSNLPRPWRHQFLPGCARLLPFL